MSMISMNGFSKPRFGQISSGASDALSNFNQKKVADQALPAIKQEWEKTIESDGETFYKNKNILPIANHYMELEAKIKTLASDEIRAKERELYVSMQKTILAAIDNGSSYNSVDEIARFLADLQKSDDAVYSSKITAPLIERLNLNSCLSVKEQIKHAEEQKEQEYKKWDLYMEYERMRNAWMGGFSHGDAP